MKEEIKEAIKIIGPHDTDKMVLIEKIRKLIPGVKVIYLSAFLDGYLFAKGDTE